MTVLKSIAADLRQLQAEQEPRNLGLILQRRLDSLTCGELREILSSAPGRGADKILVRDFLGIAQGESAAVSDRDETTETTPTAGASTTRPSKGRVKTAAKKATKRASKKATKKAAKKATKKASKKGAEKAKRTTKKSSKKATKRASKKGAKKATKKRIRQPKKVAAPTPATTPSSEPSAASSATSRSSSRGITPGVAAAASLILDGLRGRKSPALIGDVMQFSKASRTTTHRALDLLTRQGAVTRSGSSHHLAYALTSSAPDPGEKAPAKAAARPRTRAPASDAGEKTAARPRTRAPNIPDIAAYDASILDVLRGTGDWTRSGTIRLAVGGTDDQVRKSLRRLIEEGKAVRVGERNEAKYKAAG